MFVRWPCYYRGSLGHANRDIGVAVALRYVGYDFALRAQIFGQRADTPFQTREPIINCKLVLTEPGLYDLLILDFGSVRTSSQLIMVSSWKGVSAR